VIKAVYAASWLARRRFYSFSHDLYSKCAYWREPVVWGGRRVLSPSFNEMCRLPHALLMAADGKKILARAMIGIIPASGKGFFAMFDAVENAAAVRCLTDEMTRWMRGQGVCEAVGPIAPVPLDLGGGVLCGGCDEAAPLSDAYNYPYYMRCRRECGFRGESCSSRKPHSLSHRI